MSDYREGKPDRRGSAATRRARRQRLLIDHGDGTTAPCAIRFDDNCLGEVTLETMSVDRYPDRGGSYSRANTRPACGPCNSRDGNAWRESRRRARARTEVASWRVGPCQHVFW